MDVSRIVGQKRPIGYWIRHLHGLTEGALDRSLAEYGLSRRHWQVLNVVSRRPSTPGDIDAELSPFLDRDRPTLAPLAEELRERGWLHGDPALSLTEEGVRVHEELTGKVTETRARITEGITPEEYTATIDVLGRMAANLGG
ncbi:MarR family winged helix-turn-helix transcriptional regulator [Streptosporangium saharense]|uniref:DNA-binding MarR family transcriptional regulator n=1 Tax=Streptosporangium saharense TaxID=1706840 RepID=A0A7W7VSE1_9ACTN|nr:MarR family transcriptional regulator [Streptosporangium saharense]MBB4920340.1 DNA-binding MarR family transcriptional regulator [Streptosporangium saharense]